MIAPPLGDKSSFISTLIGTGSFAAIIAVIVGAWSYIMTAFHYAVGLFIGQAIYKDEAAEAVLVYAMRRAVKSPLGRRVYSAVEAYVHPRRWRETVAYEEINDEPLLTRVGANFILVSLYSKNSGERGIESSIGFTRNNMVVQVRYFRWTFDADKFMIDAIELFNNEKRKRTSVIEEFLPRLNRFKIVRMHGRGIDIQDGRKPEGLEVAEAASDAVQTRIALGMVRLLKWDRSDLQPQPEDQSAFAGYPFPDEVEAAIRELNCWMANEQWFRKKSIPWRRGWLLHGPAGTGKSTLVRSLGMTFDLPVFSFDISSMDNNTFTECWESVLSNTPCIALIEDIDAVFNGRAYVGSQVQGVPHLTFDCLLNAISGVKQADGVILIVTTNHLEKLDPALGVPDKTGRSSRPGRIDRAICLGLMAEPQRLLLAQHILGDYPEMIAGIVKEGEGETAAQFQNRCAQAAMVRFWADDTRLNKTYDPRSRFRSPASYPSPANEPALPYTAAKNSSPGRLRKALRAYGGANKNS